MHVILVYTPYIYAFPPACRAWFQSALANLRAAIVALANSNSGAASAAGAGSVVLVSNLNEKVTMGGMYMFQPFLPPLCCVNSSFFLTCLLTLFYLSSLVCVLDSHPFSFLKMTTPHALFVLFGTSLLPLSLFPHSYICGSFSFSSFNCSCVVTICNVHVVV